MRISRKLSRHFLALSITALAVAGCAPAANNTGVGQPKDSPTVVSLESQIKQLQSQLAATSRTATEASQSAAQLAWRLGLLENKWTSAEFDPTEPGFQRVDAESGVGSFAVSIRDVKQFGDGIRVVLTLGNLASANFSGVQLKIKYGHRQPTYGDPDFGAKQSDWTKALQEKELELPALLRSGSWNPITVTLPGIEAKSFGYMSLSVSTKTIQLSGN
jgi:hypothetical protein